MTTVFEITGWSNGIRAGALFDFSVGAGGLLLGAFLLVRAWRAHASFSGWAPPLFIVGWALVWLVMGLPVWKSATVGIRELLSVYRSGQAEVAEGIVRVSHQQPAGGHSSGDKITVGGKPFVVDYFLATPGYRQTLAHGGALREGVFARLHHVRGVIVKVEVDDGGAAAPPR